MVLGSSFFSSDSEGHDRRGDHRPGQRSTRARQALGRRSAGARQALGRSSAGARQELGRPSTLRCKHRIVVPPPPHTSRRRCRPTALQSLREDVAPDDLWWDVEDRSAAVDRLSGPIIQTSSGRLDEVSSHDWPSFSLSPPFMYTLFLTKSSLLRRQARLVSCSSSSVT